MWRHILAATHPLCKQDLKSCLLLTLYFIYSFLLVFSRLLYFVFSEYFLVIGRFSITIHTRIPYHFSSFFRILTSGPLLAKFPLLNFEFYLNNVK